MAILLMIFFSQLTAQQRYSDFMRHIFDQVKTIDSGLIYDEKLYRQLKLLASVGPSALPADQLDRVGCHTCAVVIDLTMCKFNFILSSTTESLTIC
jgi:hypothetical protein